MTSPRVGKVTIEAGIDTSQIRKDLEGKLTKSLHDKVLPEIERLGTEIEGFNDEMKKVSAKPFEQVRKELGLVADQHDKIAKAKLAEKKATDAAAVAEGKLTDKLKERDKLSRKLREEQKRTGKVDEQIRAARNKAHDELIAQRKKTVELQEKATLASNAHRRAVEDDEDRIQAAVDKSTQAQISSIEELRNNAAKVRQDMVNDALKEQADYNRQWQKQAKDFETHQKKLTATQKREEAKRAREANRQARREQQESFINEAAQLGRTVGALGHLGAPVAIAGATVLLADLTAGASAASQAIAIIPGAFGAIEAASLTLKIGLTGIEDAITAIFDPAADPEKIAEAIKNLSGNAQNFASTLMDIVPLWEDLKRNTQDTLLGGDFVAEFRDTVKQFFPIVEEMTTGIAGALNEMGTGFLRGLQDPEAMNAIQEFVNNVVKAFELLSPAVEPLTEALSILIGESSDVLPIIADALKTAAIEFSNFIKQASTSGSLNDFLMDGLDALEMVVGWVKLLVQEWFKLAPVGEQLLPEIDRLVRAIIAALPEMITLLTLISGNFEGITLLLKDFDAHMTLINKLLGVSAEDADQLGVSMGTWVNPLNILLNTIKAIVGLLSHLPLVGPSIKAAAEEAGLDLPQGGAKTAQEQIDLAKKYVDMGYSPDQAKRLAQGLPGSGLDFNAIRPPVGMADSELLKQPGYIRDRSGKLVRIKPPSEQPSLPTNLTEAAAPSESELKKQIEASIHPEMFDPWQGMNAPNVSQGSLQVTVDNMPSGFPGMPGMPSGQVSMPTVTDTSDQGTLANAIYAAVVNAGYSPEVGQAAVAASLLESGLSPTITNATGHKGLFQMSADKKPGDAMAQIQWFVNELGKQGGPAAANADPLNFIADKIERGNYPGSRYNEFLDRAKNLINPNTVGGLPVQAAIPAGSGSAQTSGYAGLTPGAKTLENVLRTYFPELGPIGGQENRPAGTPQGHTKGLALDINIPAWDTPEGKALGDKINAFLQGNMEALGLQQTIWQNVGKTNTGGTFSEGGHMNHIHAAVLEGVQGAFTGVPLDFTDNMFAVNGPMTVDPTTGGQGYFQVDQQALARAADAVEDAAHAVSLAQEKVKENQAKFDAGLIDQDELTQSQWDLEEKKEKWEQERQDFSETERGKFKEAEKFDASKLPFGHPAKILAGAIGGAGGSPEDIAALVGPIMGSVAQPIGQAAGDAVSAAIQTPLPGPLGYPGRPTAPSTDPAKLLAERNPMALAQLAGFDVPDYTRHGGGPGAQNLTLGGGPPGDAMGRIYSDTAALIDRTFTSMDAEAKARHDQLITVLNEVKDRLGEQLLGPVVQDAVASAITGAANEIGTAMGQAAGPIIAEAVASAIPEGGGGTSPGGLVNTGFNAINQGGDALLGGFPNRASGGPIVGPGTSTSDSILARLSTGEYVLSARDVRKMGGFSGVDQFRRNLPGYATGGGVNVNDVVGAEFFGVSQIPIIGLIVNLLVKVLLSVLGVEIEARDTLNELSGEFRGFRGDQFEAFDAMGRLVNDTSALIDRSQTSEEAAAEERIRILKIVIEALIKYIIEKLIVPIGKAVANSLIQAGAGAAGGAISGAFPGGGIVGGMVESVIGAAGTAAVDIVAEIGTDLAVAITGVAVEAVGDGLQQVFPDLMTQIFSGSSLAALLNPLGGLISGVLGGILSPFLALLGGVALPFDSGGVAHGSGLMPKATLSPERVLSPYQTLLFDRMVNALERGRRGGTTYYVEAPVTMHGSRATPQAVGNHLLELLH